MEQIRNEFHIPGADNKFPPNDIAKLRSRSNCAGLRVIPKPRSVHCIGQPAWIKAAIDDEFERTATAAIETLARLTASSVADNSPH